MKQKNKNKLIASLLLLPIITNPYTTFAYQKNETVYSNLTYSGEVKETKVNNHLSNLTEEKITDDSLLTKIINLNGEESYEIKDNKIIWNNNGKDIFYQGKTKEDLPVSVKIDYYLNDELVNPKKVLKKKGHVTIKIKLTNNMYNEKKKLHTPFVVTSGLMLDSNTSTNIEITNGEVIETGTRSLAFALASPGLHDDLKITELQSLDEIIINYDTTSFKINNIYFVLTPKLLEKLDIENLNKVTILDDSIKTISSSMDELEKGATSLSNGSSKLNDASIELINSLSTLRNAIEKLVVGEENITNGLNTTKTSLENVKHLIESKNIPASLNSVTTLINTNQATINSLENINNSLKTNYENYNLKSFSTDTELVNYFTSLNLDSNTVNDLLVCKKTYESNTNLINLLTTNNATLEKLTASITEILNTVDTLLIQVNDALTKLATASSTISKGLQEVSLGVDKMYNASLTLKDATTTLKDGSSELSKGVTTLNNEGIKKLQSSTTKLSKETKKIKELTNLSKEYKGYMTTSSNKTTFIYKTEVIKK